MADPCPCATSFSLNDIFDPTRPSCRSKAIADKAMAAGAGFLLLLCAPGAAMPQCYEVHISLHSGMLPLQAHSFSLQWHPERGMAAQPCAATPRTASLPGLPAALSCCPAVRSPPAAAGSAAASSCAAAAAPARLPGPAAAATPTASEWTPGARAGPARQAASPVASPSSYMPGPGVMSASHTAGSPVRRWGSPGASAVSAMVPGSTAAWWESGAPCAAPEPPPGRVQAALDVQTVVCPSSRGGPSLDASAAAVHDAAPGQEAAAGEGDRSTAAPSPARSPPLPQLHPRPPSAAVAAAAADNHPKGSSRSGSSGSEEEGTCLSPHSDAGDTWEGGATPGGGRAPDREPAADADGFPSLAAWHSSSSFGFAPPQGTPSDQAATGTGFQSAAPAAGMGVQPVTSTVSAGAATQLPAQLPAAMPYLPGGSSGSVGMLEGQQQLLLALQQALAGPAAGGAQPALSSDVNQLQQEVLLLRHEVRFSS